MWITHCNASTPPLPKKKPRQNKTKHTQKKEKVQRWKCRLRPPPSLFPHQENVHIHKIRLHDILGCAASASNEEGSGQKSGTLMCLDDEPLGIYSRRLSRRVTNKCQRSAVEKENNLTLWRTPVTPRWHRLATVNGSAQCDASLWTFATLNTRDGTGKVAFVSTGMTRILQISHVFPLMHAFICSVIVLQTNAGSRVNLLRLISACSSTHISKNISVSEHYYFFFLSFFKQTLWLNTSSCTWGWVALTF